jgi:Rps23 Pro-64 3,4-dihydroxylase Tpa1-like proline 4-hydroxylase
MINKESLLFARLKDAIETKANVELHDGSIMFYYWTRHSYITWHNDQAFVGGVTIYLNRQWEQDFGGFFLYKDSREAHELKGLIPKRNFALLQSGGIEHCTTPVNFNGDLRITIQAFVKQDKNDYTKI